MVLFVLYMVGLIASMSPKERMAIAPNPLLVRLVDHSDFALAELASRLERNANLAQGYARPIGQGLIRVLGHPTPKAESLEDIQIVLQALLEVDRHQLNEVLIEGVQSAPSWTLDILVDFIVARNLSDPGVHATLYARQLSSFAKERLIQYYAHKGLTQAATAAIFAWRDDSLRSTRVLIYDLTGEHAECGVAFPFLLESYAVDRQERASIIRGVGMVIQRCDLDTDAAASMLKLIHEIEVSGSSREKVELLLIFGRTNGLETLGIDDACRAFAERMLSAQSPAVTAAAARALQGF